MLHLFTKIVGISSDFSFSQYFASDAKFSVPFLFYIHSRDFSDRNVGYISLTLLIGIPQYSDFLCKHFHLHCRQHHPRVAVFDVDRHHHLSCPSPHQTHLQHQSTSENTPHTLLVRSKARIKYKSHLVP